MLPPEVQQMTANAPGKPAGGPLLASSAPIAPLSNGSGTAAATATTSDTAPGGIVPQSSFSYSNSRGSQHSTSFVVNSSPSFASDVSSFTYNVSQTIVGYSPNQKFAPNTPNTSPVSTSSVEDFNTSAVLRPSVPTASAPSNSGSSIQHQIYPTYPSLPPIGGSPQGPLLQPSQMGVMTWLPFLTYPAVYPSPFSLPVHSMPHPSVSLAPPGFSSKTTAAATSTHCDISGHQLVGTSGMQTESPSGIDKKEHVQDVSTKGGAWINEQSDAWTAHKTDTGIIYYYNPGTGESTYDKPACFKGEAIPSQSAMRPLFEHFVKTRAEEEQKEERAAQKAAIEGFNQLLAEASEDIDHNTDYRIFRKKWGSDPRFMALNRKDRELLLNERVLPLKRAAEENAQAIRAVAASSFKSMLQEKGGITINSRWSKVKDSLWNDPIYKLVKHEDREVIFTEYVRELKAAEEEAEREAKSKKDKQEKRKERERHLRKRKEREEKEMERVRSKVRRKEVVTSFQDLLVERIKGPQASWTESRLKLEKDPQGRATNPELDPSDAEKLFRDHVKMLYERCAEDFRDLLAEVITAEAASRETEDGKTVLNSWSTAKVLLKLDPRYNKMPRKEREALWRRYAEDILRKQKSSLDQNEDSRKDSKSRSSSEGGRLSSGSRRNCERRQLSFYIRN